MCMSFMYYSVLILLMSYGLSYYVMNQDISIILDLCLRECVVYSITCHTLP